MPNVCLFYSSRAYDFQASYGLTTLRNYQNVVLQAEMGSLIPDGDGWTPTMVGEKSPAGLLEQSASRRVLGYLNPFWIWEPDELTGLPYRFRAEQARAVDRFGAWASKDGSVVTAFGGKMLLVDPRNTDYLEWYVEAVLKLGFSSYFLDCMFYHKDGYFKGAGGTVEDHAEGIRYITGELRNAGKYLVGNAAWEMADPHQSVWAYPLASKFDAVCVEVPTGFTFNSKWWSLFGYPNINSNKLVRLLADMKVFDKDVWLVAKWQRSKPDAYDYSPFLSFEEHCDYFTRFALTHNTTVGVYRSTTVAPWNTFIDRARSTVTPPVPDRTQEKRLADLESDVNTIKRVLGI